MAQCFFLFLSILVFCHPALGEVTGNASPSVEESVETETCEPMSEDSVTYRCAVGLFNGARALLYDLPAGFISQLAAGSQALAECNRDPEIKRGILMIVEPLIRDEMAQNMSFGCEMLIERARLLEGQFLHNIREKQRNYRYGQDMLANREMTPEQEQRVRERLEDFELTSNEQEFLARWNARNDMSAQVHGQQRANMVAGVQRMWSCRNRKNIIEGACGLVGGAGAVGAVARAGRLARGLSATGAGEAVSLTPALHAQLLRNGLNSSQLSRLTQNLSLQQVMEVNGLLTLVRNGTALNIDQAGRLGRLMSEARVPGFGAFHRTTPEALQSIATQGTMYGAATNRRIYAFPFVTTGRSSLTAGKELGESMISFQGQAATLFNPRTPRGLWSALQRSQGHQATSVGNLIIDESQWVDGLLVVTRAHISRLPLRERIPGYTMDAVDVGTTVGSVGAAVGQVTIEGLGQINFDMPANPNAGN